MPILIIIVLIVGALGFAAVKNEELSGVGKCNVALRRPHGMLVKTKRLDPIDFPSYPARFAKTFAVAAAIALIVTVLSAVPSIPVSFETNTAYSLDLLFTVGILAAMGYEENLLWRSLGMGLIAYVLGSALAAALLAAVGMAAGLVPSTSLFNAVSIYGGALAAAAGVASLSPRVKYARRFEDGTVDRIAVSSGGFAALAYERFADEAWDGKGES